MSQQVYANNSDAAIPKPFIDQRVTAIETIINPTLGISTYAELSVIPVTGSGPFVPQVIGWYSVQRINNHVTFVAKWNVGAAPATANSVLTLTPILADPFLPQSVQVFVCQVRKVAGVFELGTVAINPSGTLTIFPTVGGQWSIGDFVDFETISFTYEMNLV